MSEEQLLRRVARYSIAVMLLTVCFSFALRMKEEYNIVEWERDADRKEELLYTEITPTPAPERLIHSVEAEVLDSHDVKEKVWEVWKLISQESMAELTEHISDRCILIRKPKGENNGFTVEENLPYYQIVFSLHHTEEELQAASILRMWDKKLMFGTPEETEPLKDFSILSYEEGMGVTSDVILTFDKCYYPEVEEQEEYYIIHLKKYSEVYDKLVVLDAGHGGKDPGAGGDNYRVKESEITLKLLLYLKELLEEKTDIKVFCTRTEDVYPTLKERADLALGMEADLFISWHCNSTESAKRNGTEVIFNGEQGKEDPFNSKEFAKICQEKLTKALGTKDGGMANRQDLHIVRRATMPMVLIETAYLSNPNNLALLEDDEKLHTAAKAVFEAILIAYQRMEENNE